jgi:hypothetical protein
MKAPDLGSERAQKEKQMSKETTYSGMLGEWKQLNGSVVENAADLGHLESSRVKLAGLLTRAEGINTQQAALTASKQEATKELREIITEGQRLANAMRVMIKAHYGIRAEKLAEFRMQPFRGRTRFFKVKPAPETPETPADPVR